MRKLSDLMPSQDKLRGSRWLRWLGPALFHPRLWHIGRRGLALGMAIGVFFGLLIPIAQIPLSAAAAVAMRANVPAAVASTLVTNPFTFGPIYYVAWRMGSAILGEEAAAGPPAPAPVAQPDTGESWASAALRRITGVGKPLLLGLALIATAVGLFTYYAVSWVWRLRVWHQRRKRLRQAAGRVTGGA